MCSTLIPYFAEPDDIRQNVNVNRNGNMTATNNTSIITKHSNSIANIREPAYMDSAMHVEDPVVSRLLKR